MRVVVGAGMGIAILSLTTVAAAQVCGDGAIAAAEACDDANTTPGDGCSATCTVEAGWSCVPTLHASGVNPAGAALVAGSVDPHWTWSSNASGAGAVPGIVAKHPAWGNLPPGNWVSTDANFGASVPGADTYWFQTVYLPATAVGTLKFDVAVAADNAAEVFVNGVSYGTVVGYGAATSVTIPATAFVAGQNVVSIRLREYVVGTPRGILMYPGGGGILSQCARGCSTDGDCDDTNECTTDSCVAGACNHVSASVGSSCTLGVCTAALPISRCVVCADTAAGTATDLGCTTTAPLCDTSGTTAVCVQCIAPSDCAASEVCQGGTCVTLPPDSGPPDIGVPDATARDAGPPDGPREASTPPDGPPDAGRPDIKDPTPRDARVDGPRVDGPRDASTPTDGPPEASTGPVDSSIESSISPDGPTTTPPKKQEEGGCDCATGGSNVAAGWSYLALMLVGLVAWRRRRGSQR